MFFEQNIQALLQADEVHVRLVAQLKDISPTEQYQVLEAQDGACTLAYKGVYLHCPESPLKEVQDVLSSQCSPGHYRVHLILGLGMGYLLDEIYRSSQGHILVYEPDLPLLRFMLENVNLSALLGSGRVWLVACQVDLLTLVRKKLYQQYQLDILILRGYAHLLAEEIPGLMSRLVEIETDRIYDMKTGRGFHFQWLQQFLENLPAVAAINSMDGLADYFSGKPALVISRGPSLDSSLAAIAELAGSAVLIAVGGALRRLYEADIVPDFAVFLDANGLQEQLYGIPDEFLEKITFLVSPFSQHCVFESPAKAKLLVLGQNNCQFADWLDLTLGRKHHRLEGGGTVSIIAFQTAMMMGCNPITLVGQDLAFPNDRVYAGGIELKRDEQGNLALTASETLFAQPETMATTLGQNGETLPTLKAYTSFIRHLEDLAASNAQGRYPVTLYNASLGGAHIAGFTLRELASLKDEFITDWKNNGTETSRIEELSLSTRQTEDRSLSFQKGLLNLKAEFQEALTLCEQLMLALQNQPALPPQQALAEIQVANRQFNQFMSEHSFVGYWLMFEMIDFREKMNRMGSTQELAQQGYPALIELISACREIIQHKALPWTERVYQFFTLNRYEVENQAFLG